MTKATNPIDAWEEKHSLDLTHGAMEALYAAIAKPIQYELDLLASVEELTDYAMGEKAALTHILTKYAALFDIQEGVSDE